MEILCVGGDGVLITPSRGGIFAIYDRSVPYYGHSGTVQGVEEGHMEQMLTGRLDLFHRYVFEDPFDPGQFALIGCRLALSIRGLKEPVVGHDIFREIGPLDLSFEKSLAS